MSENEYRDFLHSAKRAKKEINSLMLSYKELETEFIDNTSAGAIDYSVDRVQSSREPDALILNAIERRDDKMKKIFSRVEELNQIIDEVEEEIDLLLIEGDGITHEILRLYYLENVKMDDIADRITYSIPRTWQLWRIGVEKCYEMYKEANKC